MNLQSSKLELMQMLLDTKDEAVLERIREVFKSSDKDQKMTDVVKEKMTERVLKAEEDIKAGRVFSVEEAEKRLGL